MAGESGAVIISTKLNNDGTIKGVKSLFSTLRKAGDDFANAMGRGGAGASKGFEAARQKAQETELAIIAVKNRMAEIEQASVNSGDATSKAFESAKVRIEQTQLAIDATTEKMDAIFYKAREKANFNSFGNTEKADFLLNDALATDKAYQQLGRQLDGLNLKLDQQKLAADAAKTAAIAAAGPQGAEYQKLGGQLSRLTLKQQQLKSRMDATGKAGYSKGMGRAAKANNVYAKSANAAAQSCKNFMGRFVKLGSMLKLMVIRKALQAMIKAFREGFQNLAKANEPFNTAMSQMTTRMQTVKNSIATAFAPVVSALVPIFNAVTGAVVRAFNAIAAFTSKLFGNSSTFIAAKDSAVDYAAGLNKAGGAAKKAAQNMMGIDELNIVSKDDSGNGGSGGASAASMFEEKEVTAETSKFVEKVKKLLEPLSKISFDNLKKSFSTLVKSVKAFADTAIFAGLEWLYFKILVPFAGWMIEDAIPVFLDLLAAAIDVLTTTVEALKPLGQWLWDKFLEPIAKWTGGLIIKILTGIKDGLLAVSDWIRNNQALVETIAIIIGSFAAAWALVNVAIAVWNFIGGIATAVTAAFGAAVAFLTSPIGLVVLAIGAIIAIVVLLIKNWDKVKEVAIACWEGIKDAFAAAGQWFKDKVVTPISDFFTGLWTSITTAAKNAWTGIKNIFSTVYSWFDRTVITPLVNAFKFVGNTVIGVFNGIISGFESAINWIISGINSFISFVQGIISGATSLLEKAGVSVSLQLPTVPNVSFGRIPKLAQGAVIPPNREFMAVLGDQKRGINIETPLETMITAFKAALSDGDYGNNDIVLTSNLVLDGQIVATTVNRYNRRSGNQKLTAIREEMG